MSFSTFLIRAVGIGATAISAREAHIWSQKNATYKTRDNLANNLSDLYINQTVATDGSVMTENLKKDYMQWRMNDRHIPALQYIGNRINGYISGVVQNIVPLALGLGAMFSASQSNSKWAIYKGSIPKPIAGACAIALGLIGIGSVTKNVLGWRSDYPKGFL